MKREALLGHLRRDGCVLKREGGAHSLWAKPTTGAMEAVPRHAEVSDVLTRTVDRSFHLPEAGR